MSIALSKKVLSSTSSEECDMSNFDDESTIIDFVKRTFEKPLSLKEMMRLTFIVGGGKLSRGNYND